MSLLSALGLALLGGASIPAGALISSIPTWRSFFSDREVDSFITYFGGGALLAAVALVLLPRGVEHSSVLLVSVAFSLGGLVFWRFSVYTQKSKTAASMFVGMVLDFFPEAILLGVAVAKGSSVAYLLALLIALQNLPEGFGAHKEMEKSGMPSKQLWALFFLAPLLGPLAAWIGYSWMSDSEHILKPLLVFCSGGILYLIFEDIAPKAHIKRAFPAVGAILGFLLGMIGTMLVH